jgi:hypothetical protein
MPQLLTATLDDVNRKRGDLYPITATLRANGVAANLTGATVTITIVDSITRALVVLGGACTIVSAVAGTVSYQPLAADVDREGSFDVEFKEVLAGSPSHFPCADYASLRLWPTLDLPPFVPPVAGINDHSITLAMLATGTPGGVLLYDASGNAVVRANSGSAAGRVLLPVLIDEATLAGAVGYTSPTWAAGAYRELIVKFRGTYSAFAYTGFRVNGDTGNNYTDVGFNNNSAVSSDSSVTPTLGFARVGVTVAGAIKYFCELHFDPRKDGNERTGWAVSGTSSTGAIGTQEQRLVSFGWVNKVSDVTNVSLMLSTAATMTGSVEVSGVPA